jgi:hypothetical protein
MSTKAFPKHPKKASYPRDIIVVQFLLRKQKKWMKTEYFGNTILETFIKFWNMFASQTLCWLELQ